MLVLSGCFKEIADVRAQIQGDEPYMGNHKHGYRYFGIEEQAHGVAIYLEPVGADKEKRGNFVETIRKVMPHIKIQDLSRQPK